jgi:hypothetical protein
MKNIRLILLSVLIGILSIFILTNITKKEFSGNIIKIEKTPEIIYLTLEGINKTIEVKLFTQNNLNLSLGEKITVSIRKEKYQNKINFIADSIIKI